MWVMLRPFFFVVTSKMLLGSKAYSFLMTVSQVGACSFICMTNKDNVFQTHFKAVDDFCPLEMGLYSGFLPSHEEIFTNKICAFV